MPFTPVKLVKGTAIGGMFKGVVHKKGVKLGIESATSSPNISRAIKTYSGEIKSSRLEAPPLVPPGGPESGIGVRSES